MKEEYIEIIVAILFIMGSFALFFMIVDLFFDGIFFRIMPPLVLFAWIPIMIISFIIKAFQLNYKIVKRYQ